MLGPHDALFPAAREGGVATAPSVCGRIAACAWPAIPTDVGAQSLALLYQLDRTERLPPEQLREMQHRQLEAVWAAAMRGIPFWKERLEATGYAAGMPVDDTVLDRIPVLTRGEVQRHGEAVWSRSLDGIHGGIHEGQTSGSTGRPVRYLQTDLTMLFWRVLTLREHLWQGRDFSGTLAAIRSNVERGRSHTWGVATDQVFQTGPAVSLNIREDVTVQLEWLREEQPHYVLTHPSNLRALLRLAAARGVVLPGLKQVRTFGEMLSGETIALCREVWGVGIADIYSSEEIGVIAFQCEQGRYHVQAENILLEVLDETGGPLPAGMVGRVVITTLHNLAMPLVRYELGYYAARGEPCPCGRTLPVLDRVVGRRRNMIRLPDGSEHWPSFPEDRWVGIGPIRQLQAVQVTLDHIVLRVVADRSLTGDEVETLTKTFTEMLGFPHRISVDEVAEIPRHANAKFEDFVSQLP